MIRRKVLLPFHLSVRSLKPLGNIHRFKVYDAGIVPELTVDDRKLNRNFQINGHENEKLIVRVYFNPEGTIRKVLFYCYEQFDSETAIYIIKEQLNRIYKHTEQEYAIRQIEW